MRSSFPLAIALLACSPISGCATMSDVVQERAEGGGVSLDYRVDPATAYAAARDVLRGEGADAIEEHPEDGSMRAAMGMTVLSRGTLMAAWIAPLPDGGARVTVVTKRMIATAPFTGLTEETFHERLRERVAAMPGRAMPGL